MKQDWTQDELIEHWTLAPGELVLLMNKSGTGRLGFAALLKFFQLEGRFAASPGEIAEPAVEYLARQVKVASLSWADYDWQGRTIKYHRAEIRALLGFREVTSEDSEAAMAWLREHVLTRERNPERIREVALGRFRELRLEPPTAEQLGRLLSSALRTFEEQFSRDLLERLSPKTKRLLDALLESTGAESTRVPLHDLRADPGPASIETLDEELNKLDCLRGAELPPGLFGRLSPPIVQACRRRVAIEEVHELRRHPETVRITLLAAFCHLRTGELVDTLSDLLIDMVHRVAHRAEVRVDRELMADFKRVSGKNNLLFQIAAASLERPDHRVRDVVYPIANEATLEDLVREFKATGPAYRQQLHTVMRTAYRSHYRAMLVRLLNTLEFRSNNAVHRPVLDALAIVKKYAGSRIHAYPVDEQVPVAGIVTGPWLETVLERDEGGVERVNRLTYEVCVLLALRKRLRSKEVWVEGADRYRNPDQDLPGDFEQERTLYYSVLKLPHTANTFLEGVKQEMRDALASFHASLPRNEHVRILEKNCKGWISLSPMPVQQTPANLAALKGAHAGTLAYDQPA